MSAIDYISNIVLPPKSLRRRFASGIARRLRNQGPLKNTTLQTLSNNHREIKPEDLQTLKGDLIQLISSRAIPGYIETERGQGELTDHLVRRLENSRNQIVPWLNGVRILKDASILEIGCGTGSDLVALSEQGAKVTSIDIDEAAVDIAKRRCSLYGLQAIIQVSNATNIFELFGKQDFDFIIFYASLEHMTHDERISSLSQAWQMLRPGGYLAVIDTPNRLWFSDDHTSLLPFFHWLPDDLAFKYAKFSKRENFNNCYTHMDEKQMIHFLRRGRGVSFHEFVLATGSVEAFQIASYKNENAVSKSENSLRNRYVALLNELVPEIHPAFLQETLDLILKKIV